MAIPNKIVTDSTRAFNRFAPKAFNASIILPLTESSGTTFTNIGVNNDFGGELNFGDGVGIESGTGVLAFTDETADPVNGPYVTGVEGSTNRAYLAIHRNTSGGVVTIPQGTLICRIKDPAGAAGTPVAPRALINSGQPVSSAGATGIAIYRATNDDCVAAVPWGSFTFSGLDWDEWHTFIIMWGEGRFPTVIINRNDVNVTSAGGRQTGGTFATGVVTIANNRSLSIGAVAAGGSCFSISCSGAVLLDERLDRYEYSDKRINRILADPHLYFRPAPPIEDFSTVACPMVSRVTDDKAYISVVSGLGDTGDLTGVLSDDCYFFIEYGTADDPTDSFNFMAQSSLSASVTAAQIITGMGTLLEGLSSDTEYFWRAWWSNDGGVTYQPFPGGMGRFRTKRTIAGPWSPGFYADPHLNNYADIWDLSAIENIVYGPGNYNGTATPSRKALAYERAIEYNCCRCDHDFSIMLGDFFMSDTLHISESSVPDIDDRNDLLFMDMAQRAAHERNFAYEIYLDGEVKVTLGNHETENGFNILGDTGGGPGPGGNNSSAYCAVSRNARKIYWPGPTHETYPEFGGENEGDPATDDVSYKPPNSGIFAAYGAGYAQLITDFMTGTHANPRGLNKSPLENYYAFEWGGGEYRALFIVTDATYVTDVGDPDATNIGTAGARFRPLGRFTKGAAQEAWLEAVHAVSTAPIRFEIGHQHAGGLRVFDATISTSDLSYGRNNGTTEPGEEHARDQARLRRNRANGRITGHDHRACHAVATGRVNEIKAPTTSAPSHSGGGSGTLGWHFTDHEQTCGFGLAQSDGADLISFGDGLGTAIGNRKMLNVMGVMTLDIDGDPAGPLLRFVRTEVARHLEFQTIITQTGSPTGGTWSLHCIRGYGQSTAQAPSIPYNVTAEDLKATIVALGCPEDEIDITRDGTTTDFVWTITGRTGWFNTASTTLMNASNIGALTGGTSPDVGSVTTFTGISLVPLHLERNLGERVTAVSDVVTLTAVPNTVADAYLVSDVVRGDDADGDNFWNHQHLPPSVKGADVGPYPFDWMQPNVETVTLDASVDNQEVYVMNTPAILYEARLGAASEDSGTSTLINACLATRGFSRGGR